MTFASSTSVSINRTREEIESLLLRHKASRVGVVTEQGRASVGFTIGDWSVLFKLTLPAREEKRFSHINSWRRRSESAAEKLWNQTCRSCWRALLLTIKAKLVSVESGVETFEQAFLAHVVLPGHHGATVGEQAIPKLREENLSRKQLSAGEAHG